jgi:hypothetical protein
MEQLRDYADERLVNGCIYCGGPEETREHVPSRVFLDAPFPDNLPVVGACVSCNNSFSQDEQYLASLIESVIAGSTDPEQIRREKVATILRKTPSLRARLEAAKSVHDGQVQFSVEENRVRNVLLKLARGHAVFELSSTCKESPLSFWWSPLELMENDHREVFEDIQVVQMFSEVGSRNLQRLFVTQVTTQTVAGETLVQNLLINDWIEVQANRYRYHAMDDGSTKIIKIVIGEYLACEAKWML